MKAPSGVKYALGCPWVQPRAGNVGLEEPGSIMEETYGWAEAAALAPSWLNARHGEERARPRADPYTEASLALGAQPTLPALSEDPRGTRRLVMKRKVLRRRPDGGVEVSDESVTSEPEESDADVRNLRRKMFQLRAGPEGSISEGEMETSSSSSLDGSPSWWPRGDSPPFLLGDFGSRGSLTSESGRPKSFIPPLLEPPGRNRRKTDRVAKYFEYKREWEKFRIPGEDQRQELRWGIREQMLCPPELPGKPRHLHVPNAYAVPTEKKRAALRWEVRWDLARGLIPRKNTSSS